MDTLDIGEPALTIAGFSAWVHRRQFPDSTDHWDGNWLDVTARMKRHNAHVWVSGALLTTMDLAAWRDGCERLLGGGAEKASLEPVEPELEVAMSKTDAGGHIEMRVEITPDHLHQKHSFRVEIDLSYLPGLIQELDSILDAYPVR